MGVVFKTGRGRLWRRTAVTHLGSPKAVVSSAVPGPIVPMQSLPKPQF
jgi:hypothetical protein